MLRLTMVLFAMIGTAMAGSGVVAVLVMGHVTALSIVSAAAVGAVLALPVSWMVARNIS